ncbi:MAG: glycohydrolase toxin TNT-related protein [Nocardioides sp.]|nr:glycohydrolase toxin TNT-related protein [Nocardioides sp.]
MAAFPDVVGGFVVGGMDRGEFAPFAAFSEPEDAARVLGLWARQRDVADIGRTRAELTAAALGARNAVAEASANGPVTGAEVPVGAPFDHIGTSSGHCLYLYDTPMSQRSLPPTDLNEVRSGYVVSRALPATCRVGVVPEGFGQPGGGLLVKLDRVLAYYVDIGMLTPFAVPRD